MVLGALSFKYFLYIAFKVNPIADNTTDTTTSTTCHHVIEHKNTVTILHREIKINQLLTSDN